MKFNEITENASAGATGAGSVASVNMPMSTQSRNPSIYGGKKAGNLLTGKKSKGKYANSVQARKQTKVNESQQLNEVAPLVLNGIRLVAPYAIKGAKHLWKHKKKAAGAGVVTDVVVNDGEATLGAAKEVANWLLDVDADESLLVEIAKKILEVAKKFPWATAAIVAFYGGKAAWEYYLDRQEDLEQKERDELMRLQARTLERISKQLEVQPVTEDEVSEAEVLVVKGANRKDRRSGFVKHGESRVDHEVKMAKADLFATAKNAQEIMMLLKDRTEEEGIKGWMQSYITLANDYLNSVAESLQYEMQMHEDQPATYGNGEDDRYHVSKLDTEPYGEPSSSYPGGTLTGTNLAEDGDKQ